MVTVVRCFRTSSTVFPKTELFFVIVFFKTVMCLKALFTVEINVWTHEWLLDELYNIMNFEELESHIKVVLEY